MEGKHTDTIFYVVRQIAYIHGRGHFIRDRERKQYKYMEEEDHFTQTLLPALIHSYCSSLFLSILTFSLSQPSHFALTNMPRL